MNPEDTAVIEQENYGWIGWIEEVPGVSCQERTQEELLETLSDHFEGGVGVFCRAGTARR